MAILISKCGDELGEFATIFSVRDFAKRTAEASDPYVGPAAPLFEIGEDSNKSSIQMAPSRIGLGRTLTQS